MKNLSLRRAFVAFHITLGVVVFIESVRTALLVLQKHMLNPLGSHLAILAGIEAIAALLFLVPKTLKAGSILLLIVFAFAVTVHGVEGELGLLVYAAGVLFVFVHGSAYSKDLLLSRNRSVDREYDVPQ